MNSRELQELGDIEDLLSYAANQDHWCDNEGCTVQTPKCYEQHTRAALHKLAALIEPPHEGLHPRRLIGDAERVYADRWKKENERRAGVNRGFTLVEHLLCPEGQKVPGRVNFRDAQVAATVIQWLGTNCGRGFVMECEGQIERDRLTRQSWSRFVNHNIDPPPEELATAELLAGPVVSHPRHATLVREIAAALVKAKKDAVASALQAALA